MAKRSRIIKRASVNDVENRIYRNKLALFGNINSKVKEDKWLAIENNIQQAFKALDEELAP